jgi:hypothetical protein
MIEPLRHRKTKEAAGEMFNLQPPRHIPTHENATEANPDGSAAISAKFKCGTALLDAEVVQGVYATSINIHNTQLSSEVQLTKTTVQAFQGGARSWTQLPRVRRLCPSYNCFAAAENAGSLPISRGSCWMMTVALRLCKGASIRSSCGRPATAASLFRLATGETNGSETPRVLKAGRR